ncbi:MAG: hypothetical protein BRC34_10735 [Cyanobacteria bacterium QH_1_48_107]|nr:MAG: hypothetical protein BRC34_10735 [Cyanobacteria bacterium QH_1_48_107]
MVLQQSLQSSLLVEPESASHLTGLAQLQRRQPVSVPSVLVLAQQALSLLGGLGNLGVEDGGHGSRCLQLAASILVRCFQKMGSPKEKTSLESELLPCPQFGRLLEI